MRIILLINATEMISLQSVNVFSMYPVVGVIQDTDAELKASGGISENDDNIFESIRIMVISQNINGKANVSICLHSVSNAH